MNKAVGMTRGKWIYFLGADDIMADCLNRVAERLVDPGTIYYGDVFLPGKQRSYDGRFTAKKLARKNICQQAIFYPRVVFDKYSFNQRYSFQADWAFNMRCWNDSDYHFVYLPLTIATFNDQAGASSLSNDWVFNDDYSQLLKNNFQLRDCWFPLLLHGLSRVYRLFAGRGK
jgi:hypothetical protein